MSTIPPTLPFKIANAYGVRTPALGRTALQAVRNAPIPFNAQRPDTVELSGKPAIDLVAGSVQTPVEFAQPTPAQTDPATMPFYRHPADVNTAATGIDLGRRVDLNA